MWRLAIVVLFATACGSPSTPVASIPTPTPSPQPSQVAVTPVASPVLGIFYDAAAGKLSMVDSNGTVVASTAARAPHRTSQGLPWTSASQKRLYYLDGASVISFLGPDGTTGHATRIRLAAGEEAGFSVSPDDRRVAVSVLKYGPTGYLGMRIYVEDLIGGRNHVEAYSSPSVAEFPIAWAAGHLVVAMSKPFCCTAGILNPIGAIEYHVADPATGVRLVTLCHGWRGPIGPPAAIGVTCGLAQFPNGYFRWDGTSLPEPGAAPDGALSPDGTQVASSSPFGIQFFRVPTGPATQVMGDVAGWLDAGHIVYRDRPTGDLYIGLVYLSTPSSRVPSPGASTTYLGTFPTAIS